MAVKGGICLYQGSFTGGYWNAGATTAPQIFTGKTVTTARTSVLNNEAVQVAVVTACIFDGFT